MTAKQFKLPLAVRIAIFIIVGGLQPIFLIERALNKVQRRKHANLSKL